MTAAPESTGANDAALTDDAVIDGFVAYLRDNGMSDDDTRTVRAARVWWRRFGGPAGFEAAPLADQLAAPKRARAFIDWAIVAGHLCPGADYLLARRMQLGRPARRVWPGFWERFAATAADLGFKPATVDRQWVVLTLVAAVAGARYDELTHGQLHAARGVLLDAAHRHRRPAAQHDLSRTIFSLEATLFHAGVTDRLTTARRNPRAVSRDQKWAGIAAGLRHTAFGYLDQMATSRRANTVARYEIYLRDFARFLTTNTDVVRFADIGRSHVEAYQTAIGDRDRPLHHHSVRDRLGILRAFFERLIEWDHPDAPARVPIFAGDLPLKDRPLPRFLDDAAATRLLQAARAHPDPFVRLVVEMLARTGLRKSELMALRTDAVVQIGTGYWLRVPVGKLHNDRFIPLHPHLKALLDDWITEQRSTGVRSQLVFVDRGRPIPASRVDHALDQVARAAGIGNVTPHQLRHTLATQAINRGMSLEALAALLGHRDLSMTLVYARIADRTVADQYFTVTDKVEALYNRPSSPSTDAATTREARVRRELQQRMLANGYCNRPPELDCQFETVCETCTYFETTVEFRPTLRRQRDHAAARDQTGRRDLYDKLLGRLDDQHAS
jgi:site-specific recombinase XerD